MRRMNTKVSIGPATVVGYFLTLLGSAGTIWSAVEQTFPSTGKWSLIATAIIAAYTGKGRTDQAAAIAHGEASLAVPSAEEELAEQPEIPASALASVPEPVDAPPPAAA